MLMLAQTLLSTRLTVARSNRKKAGGVRGVKYDAKKEAFRLYKLELEKPSNASGESSGSEPDGELEE